MLERTRSLAMRSQEQWEHSVRVRCQGLQQPSCLGPGEAWNLRVFLQGGPEGPRSRALAHTPSPFSYPCSVPGVRAPDVGSAPPSGGRGSFILSFIPPAFTVLGAGSAVGHADWMRKDTTVFLPELTPLGALWPTLQVYHTDRKTVVRWKDH